MPTFGSRDWMFASGLFYSVTAAVDFISLILLSKVPLSVLASVLMCCINKAVSHLDSPALDVFVLMPPGQNLPEPEFQFTEKGGEDAHKIFLMELHLEIMLSFILIIYQNSIYL